MAEEPAVGYDGFEAPAGGGGGAEDNLSMPLGDFMAFLETEPAPPGEEEEQPQQQPGVSRLSRCPNSLRAGFRDVGSDLAGVGAAFGGKGFGLRGGRIRRISGGIFAPGLAILDDLGLTRCCCTFWNM
jgi:hypothetical protein